MVKRKRITSQNFQDDKNEDGAIRGNDNSSREEAKATDNRIVGGGVSSTGEPPTSLMCATRSRSQQQLIAGRNDPSSLISLAESDGKSANVAVTPRSSPRVSNKRPRTKEATLVRTKNRVQQPSKKSVVSSVGKQLTAKSGQLRTRRSWELWSVEDKDSFFEALCEYGKDFENIQTYIAQKSKRRGVAVNMIKNKDQVRHFYYRSWHKISKYLKVKADVKKSTLELYGLINYAELRRKKGGCLNPKNQEKLNELVIHGLTTVKCKGKNLKIKTPVCRALKKLNNIADTKEPEVCKLPRDILVEFRPKTNAAWMRVQSMAQNPRARTKVGLHKRLSTLLTFLERRWKPYRLRQKEKILDSIPELASVETSKEKTPNIRVYLQSETMLSSLSVSSVDSASSADVCLDNYIKGLGMSERLKDTGKSLKVARSRILPLNAIQNSICSKNVEDNVTESASGLTEIKKDGKKTLDSSEIKNFDETEIKVSEESDVTDPETEAERSLSLLKHMILSIDGSGAIPIKTEDGINILRDNEVKQNLTIEDCDVKKEDNELQTSTKEENNPNIDETTSGNTCPVAVDLFLSNQSANNTLTFGQFLSLRSEVETMNKDVEPGYDNDTCKMNDPEDEAAKREELEKIKKKEEELRLKIRNGWIREECRTLTIGELYLMLNHPEKIILEYDFEIQGDPQVKVLPNSGPEAVRIPQKMRAHQLVDVLDRLVTVASFYFTDFKAKPPAPLSPTNRSHCRSGLASTKNIGGSRGNLRNQGVRGSINNAKASKPVGTSTTLEVVASLLDGKVPNTLSSAVSNTVSQSEDPEKHKFAMPVRAAPRPLKTNLNFANDSGSQDLDNLAAIQKPSRSRRTTMVPRPLFPTDNPGMTVVHLMPSNGPITPLSVTNVLSKATAKLPPVKILNSAPQGLSFQSGILSPSLSSSSSNPSAAIPTETNDGVIKTSQSVITSKSLPIEALGGTNSISINPLSLNVISPDGNVQETISNLRVTAGSGDSPPQISIPETPITAMEVTSQQAHSICSLLDLNEGLSQLPQTESEHLLDFNSNSSIPASFEISTKSESSSNRLVSLLIKRANENDPLVSNQIQATQLCSGNGFKINSPAPETNWLNGESSDFSLSSLLTFESPVKNVAPPPTMPSTGSTLDTISRLGSDVDTNLQCLINETSVDYVAKFADLAAQIASTAAVTENKCA